MDKHEKNCECLECTDFWWDSSIYGFKVLELLDLDQNLQNKLMRMIARIMERAYRRGVQQAITLYKNGNIPDEIISNLHDWRYDNNLDISPGLHRGFQTTSLERLEMEESLIEIGLSYDEEILQ